MYSTFRPLTLKMGQGHNLIISEACPNDIYACLSIIHTLSAGSVDLQPFKYHQGHQKVSFQWYEDMILWPGIMVNKPNDVLGLSIINPHKFTANPLKGF